MIPTNKQLHDYVDRGTGKCARMCCDRPKEDPIHNKTTDETNTSSESNSKGQD